MEQMREVPARLAGVHLQHLPAAPQRPVAMWWWGLGPEKSSSHGGHRHAASQWPDLSPVAPHRLTC